MDSHKTPMERRDFLRLGIAGAMGLLITGNDWVWLTKPAQAAPRSPSPDAPLDPTGALQKLMQGNQRFVAHRARHPHQSLRQLQATAQVQHPFATVLSCADSRVSAEILFDQGIGDIFNIRVAGNIVTPEVLGSIEYAVALLETPVLMILGHERCGAVTAAVKGKPLPGEIGSLVKAILPAVEKVKGQAGDWVENAVVANVGYQIECLERSPLLGDRVRSGQLRIVGGRYDLDTGSVTLL